MYLNMKLTKKKKITQKITKIRIIAKIAILVHWNFFKELFFNWIKYKLPSRVPRAPFQQKRINFLANLKKLFKKK